MKILHSLVFIIVLCILIAYNSLNALAATSAFDARIAFSQDDAEEMSTGYVHLTRSGLHFMKDGTTLPKAVGMLWSNVQIPKGATITSAYISFTVATTGSVPADVRFRGQAADNALSFTTVNSSITSRPKTTAFVDWMNIPPWNTLGEEGFAEQTVDLSPIIQEIVNRPGWATGNNIVIIALPVPNSSNYGPRIASTFNYNPSQAARLHIEYTTPDPTPTPTPTPGPTSTIPNFKVAFVGDLSLTLGTTDLLYELIVTEGAQMLLLLGDLDHEDNPTAWEDQINDILGPDFPVFAAIGNHELDKWDIPFGYLHKLLDRLTSLEEQETITNPTCTGDLGTTTDEFGNNHCIICDVELGVKSACKYKGLFFILSGIGTVPFIDQRIASSSNDAEETSQGYINVTSADLDLMIDGAIMQRAVGMRWTNIQIPKGAIITNARIIFTAVAVNTDPVEVRFTGQAADNAPTFTSTNGNISSRPRTTPGVNWVIPPWNTVGEEGGAQETPNLSSIVQEIVNRPGWAPGNSMVLIATKRLSTSPTGPRRATTFDYIPSQAARLHVEYYTVDNEYISYINNQLALDNSLWRVCAWHKPQRLMQVGNFINLTGWGVYEECRKGGAIVATAHDVTYSRTHLMDGFETQSVASTANPLVLEKGKSFVAVSGLGGGGIGSQVIDGNWWASVYASACLSSSTNCQANATYGALFCTFNVNGQPDQAHCYFKDINGFIVDAFDLISDVQLGP